MTKIDELIEAVDVLRDASYCAAINSAHSKGFVNGEGRPTKVYREPPSITKQKEARATIKGYAELKAERDRYREALVEIHERYLNEHEALFPFQVAKNALKGGKKK